MNTRRKLLIALGRLLVAAPLAAIAQQARRVYRIGYISAQNGPGVSAETFRRELRALGYVEGQNLSIEYRWAARGDRLAKLAAELVALKPDLIVSLTHAV